MLRSELDRRLIKFAANELNYAMTGTTANDQVGKNIGTHFQYFGAVDPESVEGKAYLQQHNIPLETAKFYHQQGQAMRNYARTNWRSVYNSINNNGFDQNAFRALPPISNLQSRMSQGFDTNSQLMLARRNPGTSHHFDEKGNIITDSTLVNTLGGYLGNTPGAFYLGNQFQKARPDIEKQLMQGMGQSFDRNSPFVRGLIADAGTGYLRAKLDEWAPRDSTLGQAFNSFGNLALGMASMVPGYESAMNWLADWQYGDKFKELQSTLNPNAQAQQSDATATTSGTTGQATTTDPNANKPAT